MSENSEQTAARNVLQSSELTARLLRRVTSSPGVVETTMLRQLLARLAGWDARPSSLFDELMSRYSIDDDSIDVDKPLVMEQSWMANINAYLTNSNSFSSTINQFISGVAASQSSVATGATPSSKLEEARESHSSPRELHSSSVTSQLRKVGLPPLSTFSSNAPSSSSSGHLPNPGAQRTTHGDAATFSPAAKFRISRSPARRAWDAAPADASDTAPRMVLKSSEALPSTASEEMRTKSEEARPTKATSEKIEQPGVMKNEPPRATESEHSRAISSSVKAPGELPLGRTQTAQSEIQRKLPDEGESVSQQVSKAGAIREGRQPSQVEHPALTVAASPKRGPANPARDIKKTGSASNESVRFEGEAAGMDTPLQSNAASHPAPAQAHILHPVSAPAKTLTASSDKTLPLVQKQIDSSPARKQSPDFVWRKGADPSTVTNPTASATGSNPVQAANQAADKTSTIQAPHSQTVMSEATRRKDELRAGSGVTTERILRNLSRKLLVERERRGY